MSKNVLIVDDSLFVREVVGNRLRKAGYFIVGETGTGASAITLALALKPDIIALDNRLPDMLGREILEIFRQAGISSKIVLMSTMCQEDMIDNWKALGACAYILKPFWSKDILPINQG